MIKINSNRVNYDEIIKNIVSSLRENIKILINKSKFDRTFKATVIGNIKGNKYQVLYKGEKYTVTSDVTLVTDQIVRVCAPQNNWSELFVVISGSGSSGGGDVPSGAYVSGVKGEAETAYKTGQVNITKSSLGLGNVENKSSETIRSEITSKNVTDALGYSPIDTTSEEYQGVVSNSHTHSNKSILDTITETLINGWNSAVTHITDTVKHITSTERIKWNAASEQAHGHENKSVLDDISNEDITNWDEASTHSKSDHAPINAEENQNAFSNIAVDDTTIAANSKTDTFKIKSGNNVTITANQETKEIEISAEGEKYDNATSENDGLMSSDDKEKLDGIEEGANKTAIDEEITETGINAVQGKVIYNALKDKVDKEEGKGLSSNDFTNDEKNKLSNIEAKANKTIVDDTLSLESENPVQNKVVLAALNEKEKKIVQVTNAQYEQMLNDGTLDENTYYLTIDDETNNLIAEVSGFFTLAMEGWDLVAYYNDSENTTAPPISFDPETWNIYYEVPDEETSDNTSGEIDETNENNNTAENIEEVN